MRTAVKKLIDKLRGVLGEADPDNMTKAKSPKSIRKIIQEALEGRRRPLRGRQLVDLARKIGLDWEDTGTGWKPNTLIRASDGRCYRVNKAGSFESVLFEDGHLYKPAPKMTKKERNRLKKEHRAAAPSA